MVIRCNDRDQWPDAIVQRAERAVGITLREGDYPKGSIHYRDGLSPAPIVDAIILSATAQDRVASGTNAPFHFRLIHQIKFSVLRNYKQALPCGILFFFDGYHDQDFLFLN